MFEREIIDGRFVNRWSIVRRLREQSISEHSHLVTIYANDIALHLELPMHIRLAVALYAPWHDLCEEIFTGDSPGPNKRALFEAMGPASREDYDAKVTEWRDRVFPLFEERAGLVGLTGAEFSAVKLVVKVADWLEAATAMATETQLGNQCTLRHIRPNMLGAIETAHKLCNLLQIGRDYKDEMPFTMGVDDDTRYALMHAIEQAVADAHNGQSAGPYISGEDADRQGRHDPCVSYGS